MENKKIERINELAKKSKLMPLTDEEKIEQKILREEYIESFRKGVVSAVESVIIMDEKGNKRKIEKKIQK